MKLITVFAVALIFITFGQTFMYADLRMKYNALQNTFDGVVTKYDGLVLNSSMTESQLLEIQKQYQNLLGNYSKTQTMNQNHDGTYIIWNRPSALYANSLMVWELLDAFINNIQLRTSAPAHFMIMSMDNYVSLTTGQPYMAEYDQTGTSFSEVVTLAQGCGGYILVIGNPSNSTIIVTPNITAIYSPTPFLTGICNGG